MRIRIPVARAGWPFILIGLLLLFASIVAGYRVPAFLFGIATLCVALFFRDPERKIVRDGNVILSPADGRILQICSPKGTGPDNALSQEIRIFMSVLNCHINRIPLSGKIVKCEYNPGKFLPAFREKASELNEQNTLLLATDSMQIGIRQIAGLIARRIVCRVKPGDLVEQGNRFGLIRFGSRVDLFLPSQVEILVKPGQKVKSGLSPIARIKR